MEMEIEIEQLIGRRAEAGFPAPLKHHQGTMTSAHYDCEGLVPYADWGEDVLSQDGDELGSYGHRLIDLYEALGIWEGNGEWYESAWRYDRTIDPAIAAKWEEFVTSELSRISVEDYWEWREIETQ